MSSTIKRRACFNGVGYGIGAVAIYLALSPVLSFAVIKMRYPDVLSRIHTKNNGDYLADAKTFLKGVYDGILFTRVGHELLVGWFAFGFAVSFVFTFVLTLAFAWIDQPPPGKKIKLT
jgi:hypothetical protein